MTFDDLFSMPSIESIKKLGVEKSDSNFTKLLVLFDEYKDSKHIEIIREIVSSIGRQKDNDRIYNFLQKEIHRKHYMEVVYQMFRTTLYKSKEDSRFENLRDEMLQKYNNEVLQKMLEYYEYKQSRKIHKIPKRQITKPSLLIGDNVQTLSKIGNSQVQLIFTSPPYYNARVYSDYQSYQAYLDSMKNSLKQCHRILEDGRFIIINVSPVISRRAGREFESIRYPIHFDFHRILVESNFYFIDEILWIKPEYSVPNRIAGYLQTKKPLSYKPNCISESLLVYRKNSHFLLDKNIKMYDKSLINDDEIDPTNC